ncbi:MAG: glucose 1-dehydrogenase [Tagaea sp.]|nr:glucose 1-dehydrogenase [Tagaea sp.]
MELHGKSAIVTGAGSGFGKAIAARLAAAGAGVLHVDLDAKSAEAAAAEARNAGGKALACRADVAVDADVRKAVQTATAEFGDVDILVNNAGYTHPRQKPEDVTEDDFDRVFAVNVKSIYLFVKHVAPGMKARRRGAIVNIASTAARRPGGALTWYAASKGAVVIASQSLAVDLGPYGVRVNSVNPVIGETGLLTRFTGVEDTPEARHRFTASIPLGRYCKPDDVANAVHFLVSPSGDYITGSAIDLDGGFLAGNYMRAG